MINLENTLEFVCPKKHEVSGKCICLNVYLYMCACTNVFSCSYGFAKCCFNEWLYGPKNQWPEPPKAKEKKKERLIYKAPPVKCECGVKSNYGLVPSELGVGHYCGHMVDYDEVGYFCGKHEIVFCFFC